MIACLKSDEFVLPFIFFFTKPLLLELVSLDWKGIGDGDDGRWTLDDGRWTMDDGRMDDGWVDYF